MSPALEAARTEWQSYLEASAALREELLRELSAAWEDARTLLQSAAEAGEDLTSFVRQWELKRPISRTLAAFEQYDTAVAARVRTLHAEVPTPAKAFLEMSGVAVNLSALDSLRALFAPSGKLLLRQIVVDHELLHTARRAAADEDLQCLLENTCLALRDLSADHREGSTSSSEFNTRCRVLEDEAASILLRLRRWADSTQQHLVHRLAVAVPLSESRRARLQALAQSRLSAWSRRQRAVSALLDLESRSSALMRDIALISADSLRTITEEHERTRQALLAVAAYLDRWNPDAEPFEPPAIEGRIASAEERLDEWNSRVTAAAVRALPEFVECFQPRSRWLAFVGSWQILEPRRAFLDAIAQAGAPAMRTGLDDAAAENLALARQIDRVREVILYGQEAAVEDAAAGRLIRGEAISNSRRLLADSLALPSTALQVLERVTGQAASFILDEFDAALQQGFGGVSSQIAQRRGARFLARARRRGETGIRAAGAGAAGRVKRGWERFLVFLGWSMPSRDTVQPVAVRPDLDSIFSLQFGDRELPLIYKRLFRLAPVDEPRYLIGREEELRGIEQALTQWESGGGAAVLVAGARGSGKTSLLNCAVKSVLSGRGVCYSRFPQRITSPEALELFLSELLGAPAGNSLASALEGRRAIVILEELERCYLRRVGGLDAMYSLLALVQQTAGTILWVFSVNDHALRFLDPAADLRRVFTHVINVTSMTPDNLRKAILQRHHLSGLRLNFTPPPAGDRRVRRLRRVLGLEGEAAGLFFEELYRQSGGVFRTASELWQANIERVEAGAVQMLYPARPDHGPLISAIDQLDHFTLHAVLQHGSLDVDELSEVLAEPVPLSTARLRRIQALGIIEKDPDYPGFRVRPEARIVVQEALGSVNLI